MRNKFAILTASLLVTYVACAWMLPVLPGNDGGPQIIFAATEHDFGTMAPGDEAVHYFVFTNDGDAPLVIVNVRASCGCMASEWTKKPVDAGAKDSLRVEYNTKIKGSFSKTITVQSNAVNPTVELKIRGSVIKGN
jgi:hypothetical protein